MSWAATPSPSPPGLSELLVKNSARAHKRSNALLMTKVATLLTDRQLYGRAIGCFYLVFVELEAALKQAMDADPRVGAMRAAMAPLWRVPAYEADLAFYLGDGWREQLRTSPSIEAYAARLRQLAVEQPLLLLAHSFTQHLAGLSGGRFIKRLCRKYMTLPEDKGTAIFDFPGGVELKDAFKSRLDGVGVGLGETEVQALLDEQVSAFELNTAIMREFQVGLLPRLRMPLLLVPPRYWAAAAALLLAAAAALAARRGA